MATFKSSHSHKSKVGVSWIFGFFPVSTYLVTFLNFETIPKNSFVLYFVLDKVSGIFSMEKWLHMYCRKKMNGADNMKKYILILNPQKHIKIWQIGFITSIMETGYVQQEQKGNTFHLWCSKPNDFLICINHSYIYIIIWE